MSSLLTRRFQYRYDKTTFWLIGINVAVSILILLGTGVARSLVLVVNEPQVPFQLHQLLTYMFVHADFNHILGNMLALFFFGSVLEQGIGSKEFILFYLVTGALVGLFSAGLFVATEQSLVLMGASGAVYAVLLAFATLNPQAKIFMFGFFPVRAPVLVGIYFFYDLFFQIRGGTRTAHFAHLAGLAFAWLYLFVRFRINAVKILLRKTGAGS